jgi:Ca2+-binding RTX toxin-like protein
MRKIIHGKPQGEHIDGTRHDDKLYGEGGNDGIGGHRGNDLLDGGSGDDRLHGGQGHDKMIGGTGDDTFIFREFAKADSDIIKDFRNEVIELDKHVFATIDKGPNGVLLDDEFVLGTKALDDDDRVIYDKAHGRLYYDDDGAGGHSKHLLATLDNHAKLSADDIFIL